MEESDIIIWSATPTPFCEDGSIDAASVERLVLHHIGLGVTGLFIGGSCGEGPYMPTSHLVGLARETKKYAGDKLHVSVQVSDTSPSRVRENMKRLVDTGADSFIVAPSWIQAFAKNDFMPRYFLESLDNALAPMGIYFTIFQADTLEPSLVREIVMHPSVKFIKDSTGKPEFRKGLMKLKPKRPDVSFLTGFEWDVLAAIDDGYDGCLLGTGIFNAKMIRKAIECHIAEDVAQAQAWHERSNSLLRALFRDDISLWLGGLKYALTRLGIFSSDFLHLSFPITQDDKDRIDAALEDYRGFIMPE